MKRKFTFQTDDDIDAKLEELAKIEGRSKGGLIKWWINLKYAELEDQRILLTDKGRQVLDSKNNK